MRNNKAVLVDFPNCFFIRNSVLLTTHIFEKTTRTGKVHFAVCDKIDENLKFTGTDATQACDPMNIK